MLDQAQGVYARSLARTLAERLTAPPRLAANLATLTADGPLDGENGEEGHGWIVASQPWTLEEACHIGLPDGTEYVLHGSAELTDRVRLRILLVDPAARGLGIGARLVGECLAFARRAGYRRIVLWTNDVLTAARRIYQAAGFRLTGEEPHRSFGHDLVSQTWQLDF